MKIKTINWITIVVILLQCSPGLVIFISDDIGKILPVRIKQSNRSTLFGELINDLNQKVA